jgi:hypothetical protein
MTARQQLARLLPLVLLILVAIAGLRGQVTAPKWTGPLRADGVVIGLVLEVILGTLLVITFRRGGTGGGTGDDDDGSQDVPAALRFTLRWVLGCGMLAVAVLLLTNLHLHFLDHPRPLPAQLSHPFGRTRPTPSGKAAPSAFHIPLGPILYGLLIAAMVAAVVISIWWSARLRRPAAPTRLAVDIAEDAEGLRDAVRSGRAAIAELDDARAAIIACYLAMEGSLADHGTLRNVADTPDELLARATASGIVRGQAARRLTALFYEARFSSHPLGQAQREAAGRALDELAAELDDRAGATP